jgi:hypothetical protein
LSWRFYGFQFFHALVKELLAMNEELKRARKAFDLDKEKLATEFSRMFLY